MGLDLSSDLMNSYLNPDDVLFDGLSGCCYQPIINKDKLPLLLMGDSQIPFKLGLLHLAVINLKDATLNKKVVLLSLCLNFIR